MKAYNVCGRCKRKIYVIVNAKWKKLMLEDNEFALCRECLGGDKGWLLVK